MSVREPLTGFWRARSGRERAAIGGVVAFLGMALLYALVWEPGMIARERLAATLPSLRAQFEDMRLQQEEVSLLRKKLAAAPQRSDLKSVLQGSAALSSFAPSVQRLEIVGADRVTLVAGPVSFDAWLDWVAGVQRDFGARVEACRITATDQAGMVRVVATFVGRGAAARESR